MLQKLSRASISTFPDMKILDSKCEGGIGVHKTRWHWE